MLRVDIYNRTQNTPELLEVFVWKNGRLTSDRFKCILNAMFYIVADSIDYKELKAEIKMNEKEIMAIDCKTESDGSNITSIFSKDGETIRAMTVAA